MGNWSIFIIQTTTVYAKFQLKSEQIKSHYLKGGLFEDSI
jgi:hypothetical protein